MLSKLLLNDTDAKLRQFLNAFSPISVTLSGIEISRNPLQFSNKCERIEVIPSAKDTEFRLLQPLNGPFQSSLIVPYVVVVNVAGIETCCRLVQFANAFRSNLVNLLGSDSVLMAVDSNADSYMLSKLLLNDTDAKLRQFLNAFSPISVTLSGIEISRNPLQFSNKCERIEVIPSAKDTEFRLLQPLNGPFQSSLIVPYVVVVNVAGIETCCRLVQFANAFRSNLVNLLGSDSVLMAVDSNADSYMLSKLLLNDTDVKLRQPLNASCPISVTVSGIVTAASRKLPLKALLPIAVTVCPSMVSGMNSAATPPL